jgi:hypothetical protein
VRRILSASSWVLAEMGPSGINIVAGARRSSPVQVVPSSSPPRTRMMTRVEAGAGRARAEGAHPRRAQSQGTSRRGIL